MKRIVSFILSFASLFLLATASYDFSTNKKATEAYALESISTSVVSPASYPEYLALSSPVDVYVSGEPTDGDYVLAIAEPHKIFVYRNGVYKTYPLPDYTVSKLAVFGDYVIFLSSSGIYYFSDETPVENGCVKAVDSLVKSANSFILSESLLIVNPSSEIRSYEVVTTETRLEFHQRISSSLGFTPTCLTYDNGNTYYFYEKTLRLFSTNTPVEIARNLKDPRYAVAGNGYVYFSSADGIYSVELATATTKQIVPAGSVNALSSLVSPQGLFLYGKSLYVCDSSIDAVMVINTDTNEFTSFAITARGDLPNRVTSQPKSITANDSSLFILDDSQVKIYDLNAKTFAAEKLEGIGGSDKIAATASSLLLASGDDLNLFLLNKNGAYERAEIKSDTANYRNITAVCAYDKNFYFINNELIDSVSYAVVYEIDVTTRSIKRLANIKGTGELITSDVFGRLYATVYDNGEYRVFGSEENFFTENGLLLSTTQKPLASFVDIEGTVFLLSEANKITSVTTGKTSSRAEYELSLSQNLPALTALDACLVPASDKTFFLYKGFVISAEPTFGVATPEKLSVPEDYSVELNAKPEKVSIAKNSRYFGVDLEKTAENSRFEYVGYGAEEAEKEYFLLAETDRYALVTSDEKSAVVRKDDIIRISDGITETSGSRFAVTDVNAYSYPVARAPFTAFCISYNEKVEVKGVITLNGKSFTLISRGEDTGYVPTSMLKNAVAADSTPHEYYTASVGRSGAKVYSDEALTEEVGSFKPSQDIFVITDDGKIATVLYEGKVCYLDSALLKSHGYYAIRYLLVIVILVFALFSTGYYLVKTRVFNKKNKEE